LQYETRISKEVLANKIEISTEEDISKAFVNLNKILVNTAKVMTTRSKRGERNKNYKS